MNSKFNCGDTVMVTNQKLVSYLRQGKIQAWDGVDRYYVRFNTVIGTGNCALWFKGESLKLVSNRPVMKDSKPKPDQKPVVGVLYQSDNNADFDKAKIVISIIDTSVEKVKRRVVQYMDDDTTKRYWFTILNEPSEVRREINFDIVKV